MNENAHNRDDVFARLDAALAARRSADPATSYTASLYAGGTAAITAKIAEEAGEVIEAAMQAEDESVDASGHDQGREDHLVHEVADLWFHCMVLLQSRGLDTNAVARELARRFGVSGIEEKAARAK